MMEVTLPTGDLKQFFEFLSAACNEGIVEFDHDTMSCAVVDSAKIAFTKCTIRNLDIKGVDKWDGVIAVGMEFERIRKALAIMAAGDTTLTIGDGTFKLKNDQYEVSGRTIEVSTMLKFKMPSIEAMQLTHIAFDIRALQKLTAYLMKADTDHKLTVRYLKADDGDLLTFTGDQAFEEPMTYTLERADFEFVGEVFFSEDVRVLVSMDYVNEFLKALLKSTDTEIAIRTDHPLGFHGKFMGGDGEVAYMIAPRMEEE